MTNHPPLVLWHCWLIGSAVSRPLKTSPPKLPSSPMLNLTQSTQPSLTKPRKRKRAISIGRSSNDIAAIQDKLGLSIIASDLHLSQ